jgi:hypothetical protein
MLNPVVAENCSSHSITGIRLCVCWRNANILLLCHGGATEASRSLLLSAGTLRHWRSLRPSMPSINSCCHGKARNGL